MDFTTRSIHYAIVNISANVDVMGSELNELDGRIGDGDLGVTLINGFGNLQKIADALPDDVGLALLECATSLTQITGSSFGTLMATGLLAAGKQVKGQYSVPWTELPVLMQAALDSMIARGGANLGDKTVLDALDAIVRATAHQDTAMAMLDRARHAVEESLIEFREKPCNIGRARIYGERTVGMDDPGMVAVSRMLACLDA